MKLKSLLPALAFVAAGLTASAVVPIHFRDAVGDNAVDGGGHMVFPFVEGTEKINNTQNGLEIPYGDPLFAEDGSIEVRPFDGMNAGMGMYFRTQKLGRTEVDGPVSEEYVIFAMDYKSNRTSNDLVVFLNEPTVVGAQIEGGVIEVTDEYKTVYAPLSRAFGNGTTWGVENWENNYFWISFNDGNVKTPEWRLTVKNLRLLTIAEVEAECQNITGDINDSFSPANPDVSRDVDPEMDNEYVYAPTGAATMLFLKTKDLVTPIPASNSKLTFEYKYVGPKPASIAFHAFDPAAGYIAHATEVPTLEACADQYTSEWKKYEVDLADFMNNYNFGQKFASKHCIHLQIKDITGEEVFYFRNVKWVGEQKGAVEIIDGIDENAPVEYFNLQGVRVAEPANGLYIKRQGNKATKVLVK